MTTDTIGRKIPVRHLTGRQETFTQLLMQGHSQASAYRLAYPNDHSVPRTIHSSASRLAHNPLVIARLKSLQTPSHTGMTPSTAMATREFLIFEALKITSAADATYRDRLGAIRQIAELQGYLIQRMQVEGTQHISITAATQGVSDADLRLLAQVYRDKLDTAQLALPAPIASVTTQAS